MWEIDFIRGLAILLMIFDHVLFDLIEFYGIKVPLKTGDLANIYIIVQHFFAGTFIFLSGISSSFSRSNLKRGIKLFCIAFAMSLVTYFFSVYALPKGYDITIVFGVLQFLAICMILAPIFLKLNKYISLSIGAIFIFALPSLVSYFMNNYTITTDVFMMFGVYSKTFFSGDYFPLIPWLGVFIFGVVFGKTIYRERKSLFKIKFKPNIVNYVGRYSLWIYLFHQPIIIGILYLIFGHL